MRKPAVVRKAAGCALLDFCAVADKQLACDAAEGIGRLGHACRGSLQQEQGPDSASPFAVLSMGGPSKLPPYSFTACMLPTTQMHLQKLTLQHRSMPSLLSLAP